MNLVDAYLLRVRSLRWRSTCVLCGGSGQSHALDLCAPCELELPLNFPACSVCAHPLQGAFTGSLLCGTCLRRRPRFDASYCPYRYGYPVDHLVRGIKYHGALAQGRVLSELFARRLQQNRAAALPDILLPVPLAGRRFRHRGFNQAIELGRCVEQRLAIPMRADVAIRVRETREQAALDRRERRKNIRGAFALRRDLPAANIAIIDDVMTTGSTVNELARVLKRAGAQRVEVWTVARAARE